MRLGWLEHQKLNLENVVLFLLLIAGLYQFVDFKNRLCSFKPKNNTLLDGMNAGWRCIGSGFWLTCLLFVGGVMNLYWIVGLALIGFGEKTIVNKKQFNGAVGFVILGYAAFILLRR